MFGRIEAMIARRLALFIVLLQWANAHGEPAAPPTPLPVTEATPPPASLQTRATMAEIPLWITHREKLDFAGYRPGVPAVEALIGPEGSWGKPRPPRAGILTEIRWASHTCQDRFTLYVQIYLDREPQGQPDLYIPIQYGTRDVAVAMKESNYYRLPLGDGLAYTKSFVVIFGLKPLPGTPPSHPPSALVSNVIVVWREPK